MSTFEQILKGIAEWFIAQGDIIGEFASGLFRSFLSALFDLGEDADAE